MALTQEQRVQRAHVWLMGNPKYCLYSGIFLLGETTVVDDPITAYTDGINTRYGRKFMASLSDQEIRGVVLHENMHKALRHLTIWKPLFEKNARAANAACDYVINLMIRDSDTAEQHVALPKGCLLDEKYRGMDSQQVFNLLMQDAKEANSDGDGDSQQGFDEHDWESAGKRTEKEQREVERQIDSALRQGMLLAARGQAKIDRSILKALEPQVNWEEALREYITALASGKDMSTWRRPARRWIDQGVYLPSQISESMGPIVIAVDTSGSIGDRVLGRFLGEIKGVIESVAPESIELLYWGDGVVAHESYDTDSVSGLLASTRPVGGGGTCVASVPEYIKDKRLNPECVLVLTDGYVSGGWGTWSHPLLVCCISDVVAPVGKTLRIRT